MPKKVKAKLKPYNSLKDGRTNIPHSVFHSLTDSYEFKIYVTLCSLYNADTDSVVISYTEISETSGVGLTKTKQCIKSLCDKGYIVKEKLQDYDGGNVSNTYTLFY